MEGNMLSEEVDDQADRTFRDDKFNLLCLAGKHVQILIDVILKVQSVLQPLDLILRLDGGPVDAVIGNRAVMIIVADQVVSSFVGHHLIGIQRLALG